MVCRLILVLMLFVGTPSWSCTRWVGIRIGFEKNSALIVPREMARLADWSKTVLELYPENLGVSLSIGVENTEREVAQLGRMRELAVRLALIDLKIYAKEMLLNEQIRPISKKSWTDWGSGPEFGIRHAVIEYMPDSPDMTKPCAIPRPG